MKNHITNNRKDKGIYIMECDDICLNKPTKKCKFCGEMFCNSCNIEDNGFVCCLENIEKIIDDICKPVKLGIKDSNPMMFIGGFDPSPSHGYGDGLDRFKYDIKSVIIKCFRLFKKIVFK